MRANGSAGYVYEIDGIAQLGLRPKVHTSIAAAVPVAPAHFPGHQGGQALNPPAGHHGGAHFAPYNPPVARAPGYEFDTVATRKAQMDDLRSLGHHVRLEILSAQTLGTFDLWKEDIQRAAVAAGLNTANYWYVINTFILRRLDTVTRSMVDDVIPIGVDALGNTDTEDVLQAIESRLTTSDQRETKRQRFNAAVQLAIESPAAFAVSLHHKWTRAEIRDERIYADWFIKGLINTELKIRLSMEAEPLETILQCKEVLTRTLAALGRRVALCTGQPFSTVGLHLSSQDPAALELRPRKPRDPAMEVDHLSQLERTGPQEDTVQDKREDEQERTFFQEEGAEAQRRSEDQVTRNYWENGITETDLNELRSGQARDHSKSKCYHCDKIGHIKANCPDRLKQASASKPWQKRTSGSREGETSRKRFTAWKDKRGPRPDRGRTDDRADKRKYQRDSTALPDKRGRRNIHALEDTDLAGSEEEEEEENF
jgi:hypothetical protein